MTDRFCVACEHSAKAFLSTGFGAVFPITKCMRPIGQKLDPVTGQTSRMLNKPAYKERTDSFWGFDRCGQEGKYFEVEHNG
jgi:hypothetical protein